MKVHDDYCYKCISADIGKKINIKAWESEEFLCSASCFTYTKRLTEIPKNCKYKLEKLLKAEND